MRRRTRDPDTPKPRRTTIFIREGSALDRMLKSPVGQCMGTTDRLHTMAERYEAVLKDGPPTPLDDVNVTALAAILKVAPLDELPTMAHPRFRNTLAGLVDLYEGPLMLRAYVTSLWTTTTLARVLEAADQLICTEGTDEHDHHQP